MNIDELKQICDWDNLSVKEGRRDKYNHFLMTFNDKLVLQLLNRIEKLECALEKISTINYGDEFFMHQVIATDALKEIE